MTFTNAIKEAYASAEKVAPIDTIQIVNPADGTSIYMSNQRRELVLTLEDGVTQIFEPVPFRFSLPGASDNGRQDLTLEIDNVDRRISDFVTAAKTATGSTIVYYRPYLASDLTTPQMIPPLMLALRNITLNQISASGRASFADVLNRKFLTQQYTRSQFPGLGS